MFSLFKNRKRKNETGPAAIARTKAVLFLSDNIQKLQRRTANYLSAQEQKLTYRQKQFAVAIFFLSMLCTSLYPILSLYVHHKTEHPTYLKFKNIQPTISTALPDSLDINYLRFLKAQYELEKKLKDSTDSIKH